jgi:hypothetical protein
MNYSDDLRTRGCNPLFYGTNREKIKRKMMGLVVLLIAMTLTAYEAQFKIKQIVTGYTLPEGNEHISLTCACGVVKRGNSWYTIR